MDEPEPLTDLMTGEHQRIQDMLEKITLMTKDDPSKVAQSFSAFKWNMEKHLMIEEKAIFRIEDLSGMELNDAFRLMQEHGMIISLIKKIEKDIEQRDFSGMSKLLELLDEHYNFENEVFYPNLDKKLSDDRKKEILERVDEILRG